MLESPHSKQEKQKAPEKAKELPVSLLTRKSLQQTEQIREAECKSEKEKQIFDRTVAVHRVSPEIQGATLRKVAKGVVGAVGDKFKAFYQTIDGKGPVNVSPDTELAVDQSPSNYEYALPGRAGKVTIRTNPQSDRREVQLNINLPAGQALVKVAREAGKMYGGVTVRGDSGSKVEGAYESTGDGSRIAVRTEAKTDVGTFRGALEKTVTGESDVMRFGIGYAGTGGRALDIDTEVIDEDDTNIRIKMATSYGTELHINQDQESLAVRAVQDTGIGRFEGEYIKNEEGKQVGAKYNNSKLGTELETKLNLTKDMMDPEEKKVQLTVAASQRIQSTTMLVRIVADLEEKGSIDAELEFQGKGWSVTAGITRVAGEIGQVRYSANYTRTLGKYVTLSTNTGGETDIATRETSINAGAGIQANLGRFGKVGVDSTTTFATGKNPNPTFTVTYTSPIASF